jgi:peptidoglycan glycosyltransferase
MRFEGRLWQLGNVITLVVVLLSARLIYWSLVRADDLRPVVVSEAAAKAYVTALQADHQDTLAALRLLSGDSAFGQLPQPVIQRTIDLLGTITRGTIWDRNGRKLAFDQEAGAGGRTRVYTEPALAHVIGYVSGIRAGIVGLELTYNDSLLGLDRLDAQFSLTTHQPIRGNDLVLTVDSGLQRAADQALAGQAGAAVVLDADTGAVLAMASQPRFDPNRILDPAYTSGLLNGCGGSPGCQGVFINRATQGRYTPGSTFKTVTLIAALDTGQVTPATIFDFGQRLSGPNGQYYVYRVGGGVIPDPNHTESKLSLEMSYAKSANAAFARIGNEMPAGVLIDYAARFGISVPDDKAWKLELPRATPQLANDVQSLASNDYLRATTAIGQGELLTNPVAMAMVVMAVVNHGDMPLPYLVETIRDAQGKTIQQEPARHIVRNLMKPSTADLVRGMMITAVEKGSGQPARVQGLTVGGKTGTAQLGDGSPPHAWFIGFAQGNGHTVVIAVVVENAGEGHDVAAPIFARLADAAIRHLGEAVAPVPDSTASGAGSPAASSLPAPDVPRDPKRLDVVGGPGACPAEPPGPKGSGQFVWPVDAQYRKLVGDDFTPIHPGIDLGAATGAPIYAADAGVVVFANWTDLGYGNAVVIDHGNGYQTLYGHLSQLQTYCGAKVKAGGLIGLAGATGNAYGPHLHFEIRVTGGFLNPWKHLPPP